MLAPAQRAPYAARAVDSIVADGADMVADAIAAFAATLIFFTLARYACLRYAA